MEGIKDLLDGAALREIELTFDSDREDFDRLTDADLPEGFGISKIHIGSDGSVFVTVEAQD